MEKGDENVDGERGLVRCDVWRVVSERHLEWRMRKRRGSGKENGSPWSLRTARDLSAPVTAHCWQGNQTKRRDN